MLSSNIFHRSTLPLALDNAVHPNTDIVYSSQIAVIAIQTVLKACSVVFSTLLLLHMGEVHIENVGTSYIVFFPRLLKPVIKMSLSGTTSNHTFLLHILLPLSLKDTSFGRRGRARSHLLHERTYIRVHSLGQRWASLFSIFTDMTKPYCKVGILGKCKLQNIFNTAKLRT